MWDKSKSRRKKEKKKTCLFAHRGLTDLTLIFDRISRKTRNQNPFFILMGVAHNVHSIACLPFHSITFHLNAKRNDSFCYRRHEHHSTYLCYVNTQFVLFLFFSLNLLLFLLLLLCKWLISIARIANVFTSIYFLFAVNAYRRPAMICSIYLSFDSHRIHFTASHTAVEWCAEVRWSEWRIDVNSDQTICFLFGIKLNIEL